MRLGFSLLLSLTPAFSKANPLTVHTPSARAGYTIHERPVLPPNYHPTRRLPTSAPLPLRIALKQRNLDLLPELLLSVSDPESSTYGEHWTPERIASTFAPHEDAVRAVKGWLEMEGVNPQRIRHSTNRAWIEVGGATAGEVERILDTRYRVYKREDGEGEEHIGPNVEKAASMSTGAREPHSKRADGPSGCDTVVTLECLRSLYNMTYTPKATDRNTFGIDTFFRNYSPALVGKSPELVSIDGGNLEQDANTSGGEAGWALQYAMSLVQPQPVQLLQIGNSQIPMEFRTANEFLDAVDGSYCTFQGGDDLTYDPVLPDPIPGGFKEHSCGTVKAPYIVSNSQADFEHRFSQFYLERQCAEFAKLGLMGVTVLYSAGNAGASGATNGYCLTENGSMTPNATHFTPSWPASCPWVTAVGGTQVIPGAEAVPGAEEVWNQEIIPGFFESGGGGFSNRFTAPTYQKRAVEVFVAKLEQTDPAHLRLFNNKGVRVRVMNSFLNVDNGSVIVSSGTSGSVPTVASIITLVNDARLAAGKKPVGFINPAWGLVKDAEDYAVNGTEGSKRKSSGTFEPLMYIDNKGSVTRDGTLLRVSLIHSRRSSLRFDVGRDIKA
ncbi:hypothetical protein DXG01_008206 [Tephrocybe rancida]|nr:hypothetical protein DXG01_008206 [Tephrocybe rancida]